LGVRGRLERVEDVEAWQKARLLTRDFGLRDQIRRAAVSVISNTAEGFERQSQKEFTQFLFIAKGSAAEVQAQLS
jgi:four helix bundle protein